MKVLGGAPIFNFKWIESLGGVDRLKIWMGTDFKWIESLGGRTELKWFESLGGYRFQMVLKSLGAVDRLKMV